MTYAGKRRIIVDVREDSVEQFVGGRSIGLTSVAGFHRSNLPTALAGVLADPFFGTRESQLTVKCHRRLQRDEWLLRSNPACEWLIEAARLFFAGTRENIDACSAETLKATAGIDGIRIVHGRDDALNARGDDRFRARASAPGVIARFERDVKRRAARLFTGGLQRDDFRVVAPFVLMKTFTDDLALAHDNATHHGIGAGEAGAFAGQGQRVLHEAN